jgi:hypothetical protein
MEQYRSQIDAILGRMGLDYRLFRSGAITGDMESKVKAWAAANPDDPLAQRINSSPNGATQFLGGMLGAQRGLRGEQIDQGEWERKYAGVLGITAPQPGQQGPTPEDQERNALTKWIQDFTTEMSRDVGPGDPMFDSLQRLGASRASMGVGASGIRVGRGGLGELAIQQGAMNATQPYLMQRKQMAQQGLGMLDQRDRGIEQLRQGAYGLNLQQQALDNNIAMQKYGQQADAAGGVGGTIGGILGGVAGGIATIATGGAAAPLIPGLIAGGSSIGAGIGQSSVRRPGLQSPRPYGGFSRGGGYT